MADKRNNDWTDALRERLSSSELAPASDIWSKVEDAAAEVPGSSRTLPKPFWWAAGCIAAAALAAVILLVDPRPQTAPSLVAESAPSPAILLSEIQEPDYLSDIPEAAESEPSAPQRQYRPSSVPPAGTYDQMEGQEDVAESKDDTHDTDGKDDTDNGLITIDSRHDTSDRPSLSISRRPVEEMLFENIPDDTPKQKLRLSASLFASGIPGGSGTDTYYHVYIASLGNGGSYGYGNLGSSLGHDAGTPSEIDHLSVERKLKNIHHHRPVSIGLALSYPLTDRWFLESGLMYSYLRSEYDLSPGCPLSYMVDGKEFVSSGKDGGQRLHFIGIPLKVGYRFTTPSRFSVSLSAGAMAERCVYGEWLGNKVPVGGTQFSAVASTAVQYRMAERLSLFLSPEWSYYFTETGLPTYRTETPFSMTLRLGLNLDLGR